MKTRSTIALGVVVALAGLIAGSLWAADKDAASTKLSTKGVKCPVSGEAIDPSVSTTFEKGKVYFCCDKCPAAFQKDPSKYAAKAHLQMVQTDQLKEVACPFTGKPLNPETAIDVGGVKVAFCCNNCKAKAEKAKGDEQISLVFKDVSKGFKPTSEVK